MNENNKIYNIKGVINNIKGFKCLSEINTESKSQNKAKSYKYKQEIEFSNPII